MYIDRQLEKVSKPEKCFMLARDCALFTHVFGEDRAHDVGQLLTEGMKILPKFHSPYLEYECLRFHLDTLANNEGEHPIACREGVQ